MEKQELLQTETQTETEKSGMSETVFSILETVVGVMLAVFLIITFAVRPIYVDGKSMLPTFEDKDFVLTTPIHGKYKTGDVVVVRRKDDTVLIKRVIAVEGDVLSINFDTSEVSVNGKTLDEPYINEATKEPLDFNGAVTVEDGHVFVMGDNRNNSNDSRSETVGQIDERNVLGKVLIRILPFDKFKIF